MFWIIYLLILISNILLINHITKLNKKNNIKLSNDDGAYAAILIIAPFIPIINLFILISTLIVFASGINWVKIFYKIYGKK